MASQGKFMYMIINLNQEFIFRLIYAHFYQYSLILISV